MPEDLPHEVDDKSQNVIWGQLAVKDLSCVDLSRLYFLAGSV